MWVTSWQRTILSPHLSSPGTCLEQAYLQLISKGRLPLFSAARGLMPEVDANFAPQLPHGEQLEFIPCGWKLQDA